MEETININLKELACEVWSRLYLLTIGKNCGHCKNGYEISGSMKGEIMW